MHLTSAVVRHRTKLTIAVAVAFFAILLLSLSVWHTRFPIFDSVLSLTGWILVGAGVIGRIWSGSYICGFKNDKLITAGPYSVCRNPLYLFSFAGGLGIMLLTDTLLIPLIFAGIFWAYYPYVVRYEERRLRSQHGQSFDAYQARVPRFCPDFRLYYEPASYTVSTTKFRRHLGSAAWFVVVGGVVELIEGMHVAGYLPTLFRIY